MTKEEIDTIDPTMGSTLDECPRKFFLTFKLNLTTAYEPDYFISGRAWDAARGELETLEIEIEGSKVSNPTFAQRWESAMRKLNFIYDNANPRFINPKRDKPNIITLLELFLEQNKEPPYTVLASNIGFRFPYKDFYLGGELDRYMQWEPYGVVVGEDKTTVMVIGSKGYDNYRAGFKLGQYANQITHYHWAASQITEKVFGTCVLVASLDIPKRPTTIRQQFEQIWIQHSDQKVRDYLDLCESRIARIRWHEKEGKWPKEGRHCTGGWGFHQCEFKELCIMDIPLNQITWETIPQNLFKQATTWKPWDGDKGR